MQIRFDTQTALVTGAASGLGRAYALELARRGAFPILADITDPTETLADIRAAGADALALRADLADPADTAALAEQALAARPRIDILINNAGILRDRSFSNIAEHEIRAVLDIHLDAAFRLARALWNPMKRRRYGRILFTTSPSGLYGNFGQANYAAAKLALVGLMRCLAIEGQKYDIRANAIAPLAATPMTETLFPPTALARLNPQAVVPGAIYLVSQDAPNGAVLCAAGGRFSLARMLESEGIRLPNPDPETLRTRWSDIADMRRPRDFASLGEHMAYALAQPPHEASP